MSTQNTRTADVIVIGAGIIGTFHAYFAARRGLKVLLLERHDWPTEASTRNFGMVTSTIVETDSEWAQFADRTREIYHTIQQQHDITVRQRGSMYVASTAAELQVLREFEQQFGTSYACTLLDAQEALARYPFLRPESCSGLLLFEHDFMVEPRQLLRKLIPYLVETEEIEYIPHTTAVEVAASGQHYQVKDAAGHLFTAEQVFVCSGAEYRTLFPDYFRASGFQVCKLQMLRTVPQPERLLSHNLLTPMSIRRYPAFTACPSYGLLEPLDEQVRRYDIHLLLKQADDGTIIIGDSHEYFPFEEVSSDHEYTNPEITRLELHYAQQLVALPNWQIQSMWNGYYLHHPQQMVYTRSIDSGIHIVTGIAGKGMSTGPGFSQANIAAILGS